MAAAGIPTLPVALEELVGYVEKHPKRPAMELLQPYRDYEARLRQLYAQEPEHAALEDPHVNVLPLFREDTPAAKIRARDLENESDEEKSRYIMSLPEEVRRPHGSPATVQSLKEFTRNFNVFSESSLVDMDWSNVVAAGSAVANCLLPVPKEYDVSKRTLREFYHQKFAPASDVDLFLYGLTEEEAIEKIKIIETCVRDALLTETTAVRTKHAVTICSQHPVRHIQIVLRIYKSVSEILTGFDIDSSGAAYDGQQVYCTPRALQSYITQINHVDLTRRSPSYENRLSKYSHRGFEVYWEGLERNRIDPTIFERSFTRLPGLARLLVLERLPKSSDRESYLDKRRHERGRPAANRYNSRIHTLPGNIKEEHEDEVAEWVQEDEISNYNTFTIPYGVKYHAKRIEKLCYTRDLLLNAEWNQPEDREVYLHRHPAFFGRVEDVVTDCCGYCPTPVTDEEKEVAEKESAIYVSGKISFMKDDPGRQEIGSFNPLTDDDWTEMAYVGNTARLCQAIVDCDAEHVKGWLAQEGANPNARDYTGRTPLQLAVMSSSPEIVRLLVDAGARLIARIADGRTALHLAAERGDVEIVKILLDKSLENEAEEEDKKDLKRKARSAATETGGESAVTEDENSSSDESDGELIDGEESDDGEQSMATGSFVKVGKAATSSKPDNAVPEDDENDPDFFDINIIAWDTPASALHLAIVSGHEEVAKLLCREYGADVLLPVKMRGGQTEFQAVLLTLVLALALPVAKATSMAQALLSLGATSAQANNQGFTAFHSYVKEKAESLVEVLWEHDRIGAKAAINHIAFTNDTTSETPLQAAAQNGHLSLVLKLLDHGALAEIDFDTWLKSAKQQIESQLNGFEENKEQFQITTEQPLIKALRSPNPSIALELIDRGVDVNVLTGRTHETLKRLRKGWGGNETGQSALDLVRSQLKRLHDYKLSGNPNLKIRQLPKGMDEYLATCKEGTFEHWVVSLSIQRTRELTGKFNEANGMERAKLAASPGAQEKDEAIREAIRTLETIEKALLDKGAKEFKDLWPEEHETCSTNTHRYNTAPVNSESEYDYTFMFRNVTDVTDSRKAAYLDLFEAAWSGNLDKIKLLTLTSWDDLQQELPLKMAVTDLDGNSPFSLAFQRGHLDVAKAILEIVQLQYTPEEKPKARYRMQTADDVGYGTDYDSERSEEDDDDDTKPRIKREVVHQRLPIFENVGQVCTKVKSKTKPLEVLGWISPVYPTHYDEGEGLYDLESHLSKITVHDLRQKRSLLETVVYNNDLKGLKVLLDLGEHYGAQKLEPDDEPARFFYFPDNVFESAVRLGRTELLVEIIRRTGAGLPLDHLVERSGVEITESPHSYQGLTVYGRKRQDWADAGQNVVTRRDGGNIAAPLLTAALAGRIEAVEWLLSDTPLRLYLEFGRSKAAAKDSRLVHLRQYPGGFEGAVSTWLNSRSDQVIHAAILTMPTAKANALVAYLVKACPDTVNAQSEQGVTPLLLAARLGRTEIARTLLAAGADPFIRNASRENVLHAALRWGPTAQQLAGLLSLFDPAVIQRLARERDSGGGVGRTPLHRWLCDGTYERDPSVLALLLERSSGAELDYLDGAGDTILHTLVAMRAQKRPVIRAIIDARPSLLYRENAVGRTPVEMARDRFIADTIRGDSSCSLSTSYNYRNRWWSHGSGSDESLASIVGRGAETFVKKSPQDTLHLGERPTYGPDSFWDLLREAAASHPGKRRLVSLHEANEVARRLGERNSCQDRYKFRVTAVPKEEKKEYEGGTDVVARYWGRGDVILAWKEFDANSKEIKKEKDGA